MIARKSVSVYWFSDFQMQGEGECTNTMLQKQCNRLKVNKLTLIERGKQNVFQWVAAATTGPVTENSRVQY